jgi:hypothetical protein
VGIANALAEKELGIPFGLWFLAGAAGLYFFAHKANQARLSSIYPADALTVNEPAEYGLDTISVPTCPSPNRAIGFAPPLGLLMGATPFSKGRWPVPGDAAAYGEHVWLPDTLPVIGSPNPLARPADRFGQAES